MFDTLHVCNLKNVNYFWRLVDRSVKMKKVTGLWKRSEIELFIILMNGRKNHRPCQWHVSFGSPLIESHIDRALYTSRI